MRIVIDIQGAMCDSRTRGIGRHALSLSLGIARNAGAHEVHLLMNKAFSEWVPMIREAFAAYLPADRFHVFSTPLPVAVVDTHSKWRTAVAEVLREQYLRELRPDVVFITSLFEGYGDGAVCSVKVLQPSPLTAVALHDLIPLMHPEDYLANPQYKSYYLNKIESLRRADLMLSVSGYSRQEAMAVLPFDGDRITVAPNAVDDCFQPVVLSALRQAQIKKRYGISRYMVLYAPGGFDARKNFARLIQAYAQLPHALRASHQLVIGSRMSREAHDDSRKALAQWRDEAGLAPDELVLTDFVPQDDLIALYNMATLFVFPSLHEGFGLPPIEAMACGAPTLGSNASSIPEVVGHPEALFDPFSVEDMAKKIGFALEHPEFRTMLRAHGLQHARGFAWDASAKKTIAAFESLAAKESAAIANAHQSANDLGPALAAIAQIAKHTPLTADDHLEIVQMLAFNRRDGAEPQLLVDITQLVRVDARTGIQRVVRAILLQLLKMKLPLKVVPIWFDQNVFRHADALMARFEDPSFHKTHTETQSDPYYEVAKLTDPVVQVHEGDTYLALDLNHIFTDHLHTILTNWQRGGVKMTFVIYDILLQHRPDWGSHGLAEILTEWLKSTSLLADELYCISAAVAHDVERWLKKNPPRRYALPLIKSFHMGADLASSNPTKGLPEDAPKVLAELNKRPSLIMVGTIEPRKGHMQSLAALELLWAKGVEVNLVIVGKLGWKMNPWAEDLLKNPLMNKRVFWARGISDEYLEMLYKNCHCLLAASEGEGFGLPLIEAAQYGIPILARDLEVFREVAGDYAVYFDGLSPEAMADAIEQWLASYHAGTVVTSKGMPYLNWEQSAAQLVAAMGLKTS
jgi:glycosyltransferase involved in cell wall biosynthesis